MGWNAACWGWGPGYWLGSLIGITIFVFFLSMVILGAGYLVRFMAQRTGAKDGTRQETPLEILKRRYAGGEITADEFKRTRDDLG